MRYVYDSNACTLQYIANYTHYGYDVVHIDVYNELAISSRGRDKNHPIAGGCRACKNFRWRISRSHPITTISILQRKIKKCDKIEGICRQEADF